jgi:hypothetical protein
MNYLEKRYKEYKADDWKKEWNKRHNNNGLFKLFMSIILSSIIICAYMFCIDEWLRHNSFGSCTLAAVIIMTLIIVWIEYTLFRIWMED